MKVRFTRTTPMEVLLLSELMQCGRDGTSPTDLSRRMGKSRPSVYVMLRRLYRRKLVKWRQDKNGRTVTYAVTAAGRKERAVFAKMVGLKV